MPTTKPEIILIHLSLTLGNSSTPTLIEFALAAGDSGGDPAGLRTSGA